jgi:hypothetical protein
LRFGLLQVKISQVFILADVKQVFFSLVGLQILGLEIQYQINQCAHLRDQIIDRPNHDDVFPGRITVDGKLIEKAAAEKLVLIYACVNGIVNLKLPISLCLESAGILINN